MQAIIPPTDEPLNLLRSVMAREPTLANFGYDQGERAEMLTDYSVAEFERSQRWLSLQRRTKVVNPRAGTSYGLKHKVERYIGIYYPGEHRYVANGMFIAAAISMDFKVKRESFRSPNAILNLGTPLAKAFEFGEDL